MRVCENRRAGDRMPGGLNALIKKYGLPFAAYNQGSVCHLECAGAMANGLVTLGGSRLYTSLADTDDIVDEALRRFENIFQHVKKTDKGIRRPLCQQLTRKKK